MFLLLRVGAVGSVPWFWGDGWHQAPSLQEPRAGSSDRVEMSKDSKVEKFGFFHVLVCLAGKDWGKYNGFFGWPLLVVEPHERIPRRCQRKWPEAGCSILHGKPGVLLAKFHGLKGVSQLQKMARIWGVVPCRSNYPRKRKGFIPSRFNPHHVSTTEHSQFTQPWEPQPTRVKSKKWPFFRWLTAHDFFRFFGFLDLNKEKLTETKTQHKKIGHLGE